MPAWGEVGGGGEGGMNKYLFGAVHLNRPPTMSCGASSSSVETLDSQDTDASTKETEKVAPSFTLYCWWLKKWHHLSLCTADDWKSGTIFHFVLLMTEKVTLYCWWLKKWHHLSLCTADDWKSGTIFHFVLLMTEKVAPSFTLYCWSTSL